MKHWSVKKKIWIGYLVAIHLAFGVAVVFVIGAMMFIRRDFRLPGSPLSLSYANLPDHADFSQSEYMHFVKQDGVGVFVSMVARGNATIDIVVSPPDQPYIWAFHRLDNNSPWILTIDEYRGDELGPAVDYQEIDGPVLVDGGRGDPLDGMPGGWLGPGGDPDWVEIVPSPTEAPTWPPPSD